MSWVRREICEGGKIGVWAVVEDDERAFAWVEAADGFVPGAAGLLKAGHGEGYFAFLDLKVYGY
jgi:hypothetical protein